MIQAHHQDEYRIRRPPELGDAVSLLGGLLGDASFLDGWVPQLLEEAQGAEGWYVARRHDTPDGSLSAQVFVWPPGTGTRVHDHSSWGALRPLYGTVLEERYERLDDGSRPGHAHLRKTWEATWSRQDEASTVLPYDGGIHSISNPGAQTAITVHLYGPREAIDGRDYDPSRDYVCDRLDEEVGGDAH
jgi:predicted metal-dependent enzyme (double-stranded beta helix superfamily)